MIILLENSIHYAKEVDENGKFVRFVSNPNKKSYKEECLEWLEKAEKVSDSYILKSFRKQINERHALSPKQLDVCKKIYEDNNEKIS